MLELNGIIGILILVADIYALIQIFGSSEEPLKKAIWAALVIVLPVLGLIIWFVAGPGRK